MGLRARVNSQEHGTGRIVGHMAELPFGPNTATVEAFIERLRRLTPAQWDSIREASPAIGAIPDLDIKEAPEYFKAFQEATRVAKSNVFPGSESAFYEAMRTAQAVADSNQYIRARRAELATAAAAEAMDLPPDAEAEAINQEMSSAYEEESWRRVMNVCMVAVGALVVRDWLSESTVARLSSAIQPIS